MSKRHPLIEIYDVVQMIFPPLVFLLMPFVVESPRWLAAVGRSDEVAVVLAKLHGKGATPDCAHIQEQAQSIIRTAEHEAEVEASWKEVRRNAARYNGRGVAGGCLC